MVLEVNNILSQITHMASIKTIFQHCIEMNSISDKLSKTFITWNLICVQQNFICVFLLYTCEETYMMIYFTNYSLIMK